MRSRIIFAAARRLLPPHSAAAVAVAGAAVTIPSQRRRHFSAASFQSKSKTDSTFPRRRSFHGTNPSQNDYYQLLGVGVDTPQPDIKQAYYALAKKLHPDINKNDPEAQTKFLGIQRAYETLMDEDKRAHYHRVGHEAYEKQDNYLNPFIFNGGGLDTEVTLELSFMEAIQGCKKTVTFTTNVSCRTCGGTGVPPGSRPDTCKPCSGSGNDGPGWTCCSCGGSGKTYASRCKSCRGHKVIKGTKSVKLDVIRGVENSDKIKVCRSGGADPEGNKPGDLYVAIKVQEDPVFRREKSDIHIDATLSVTQAKLGGTVRVPTLYGDVYAKVKPGTQCGEKVVLKGKGIKSRNSVSIGNQYVHFKVSNPESENVSKEDRGGYEDDRAEASG